MAASITDIIEGARQQLINIEPELTESSRYYESQVRVRPLGPSIPPQMRELRASVGWCRMYLDSLSERIRVEGFRMPGEQFVDERLRDWWQANDLDEESPLAHLEAMIQSRCFITVSAPDEEAGDLPDIPVIRVESARYFYVYTNPRTRRIEYAVRFYSNPGMVGDPKDESQYVTLYLPDSTTTYRAIKGGSYRKVGESIEHNLGQVPVVPMYNRERISDRTGSSELVPELRALTDMATRVMINLQAAAELMAIPQRYIFGATKEEVAPGSDTDPAARFKAYMANILAFSAPDGKAGQFTPAELINYTGTLQELAKQAASYTGLPPQYLSFSSENPASAEAIQASESRLVMKCQHKGKMFGNVWERVMRLAMLIMDGEIPNDAYRMEAVLADPGTPTLQARAAAVTQLYANGAGPIPRKMAQRLMNFTDLEIELMEEWQKDEPQALMADMLARGAFDVSRARPGEV